MLGFYRRGTILRATKGTHEAKASNFQKEMEKETNRNPASVEKNGITTPAMMIAVGDHVAVGVGPETLVLKEERDRTSN